jgi:hypothetical protein
MKSQVRHHKVMDLTSREGMPCERETERPGNRQAGIVRGTVIWHTQFQSVLEMASTVLAPVGIFIAIWFKNLRA